MEVILENLLSIASRNRPGYLGTQGSTSLFTLTPSSSPLNAVEHEKMEQDEPYLKIKLTEGNLEVSSFK